MPPNPQPSHLFRTGYAGHSCIVIASTFIAAPRPVLARALSAVASAKSSSTPSSRRRVDRNEDITPVRRECSNLEDSRRDESNGEELGKERTELLRQLDEAVHANEDEATVPAGLGADVNYFDMDRSGALRRLKGRAEFDESLNRLEPEVDDLIKQLDDKIKALEIMLNRLSDAGMEDKASKLKHKVDASLMRTGLARRMKGICGAQLAEFQALRIPRPESLPQQAKREWKKVERLNVFLKAMATEPVTVFRPEYVRTCWKLYSSSRKVLSQGGWGLVPLKTWDLFWSLLSWQDSGRLRRMSYMFVLLQDMAAAQVPMTQLRKLLMVEATFMMPHREQEAVATWRTLMPDYCEDRDYSKAYWELGLRICSLHGDLKRAEFAADRLFAAHPDADPRALLPLIRAMAATPWMHGKAWAYYQTLRQKLGQGATIETYDAVIDAFLAASHTDYALQAFVDMMFAAKVNLRGRSSLPIKVANKFFIGKWLKRLIGAGHLSGAYEVVKFAAKKGARVDAIHLNGLIGAWLRRGTDEDVKKGEDLSWAMIRAREAFVRLRQRDEHMQWPLRLGESGPVEMAGERLRCVPKATLETYSLLADNYRQRKLHARLMRLWDSFVTSELEASNFLMNQLMWSSLQENKVQEALGVYENMKSVGIPADAYTFRTLFQLLHINRLYVSSDQLTARDISMARGFFADLMANPYGVDLFEQDSRMGPILPRTILLTLRRLKDYAGLITAARALHQVWGWTPSQAVLLDMYLANKVLDRPRDMVRPIKKQAHGSRPALVFKASNMLASLMDRRVQAAPAHYGGRKFEELSKDEECFEMVGLMEDMVECLAQRDGRQRDLEPLHMKAVAQEMGVLQFRQDATKREKMRRRIEREKKAVEHL